MEEVPDAEGHKGIEHWLKKVSKVFINYFPYIPGFPANLKRDPQGTKTSNSHSRITMFPQASPKHQFVLSCNFFI